MTTRTETKPDDHEQARLDLEDSHVRWRKLGDLISAVERLNECAVEARATSRAADAEFKEAVRARDEYLAAQFRPLPLFDRVEQRKGTEVEANGEPLLPLLGVPVTNDPPPPPPATVYLCLRCGKPCLRPGGQCTACDRARPEGAPAGGRGLTPGLTGTAGNLWRDLTARLSSHRAFVVAQDEAIGLQARARDAALACGTVGEFAAVERDLVAALDVLAAANPLPEPEKYKPRPAPEDLAAIGVDPALVKAAYCADKLQAADNSKPRTKPATVKPVQIGDDHYVCTGKGGALYGRQEAWLIPIIRRVSYEGAFMKPSPSHQQQPDETPATAYRGRLVRVKSEDWVMLGREHERTVFWMEEKPGTYDPSIPDAPRAFREGKNPPDRLTCRVCGADDAGQGEITFAERDLCRKCAPPDHVPPKPGQQKPKRPDPTDPAAPVSGVAAPPRLAATSAATSASTPTTGDLTELIARHPGCLIVCKNPGSWWFPHPPHAEEAGRVLGMPCGQYTPLAVHDLESGLQKLLKAGKRVALAETVGSDAAGKPIERVVLHDEAPATKRSCEVCGVCEDHRTLVGLEGRRCIQCINMAGPTTSTFLVGKPAVHCKLRWWASSAGVVIARAGKGDLGNWHEEATEGTNPTSEQIVEAVSRVLGKSFAGVEICELEDDARTLVLEFESAPASPPPDAPKERPLVYAADAPPSPPQPDPRAGIPGAVPDAPPRSRSLAVVTVVADASGRLVMDADGGVRLLVRDAEGAFGNWHEDDLPSRDDYHPTPDEIATACSAVAGFTLRDPDCWPSMGNGEPTEFSLRFDDADHPEAWRLVRLSDVPRRLRDPLQRQADTETLGDLAAWLSEGNALVDLKGLKPKDAAELAAALTDLWVKKTAEGGRGEQPPWLASGASPLGKAPESPEEEKRRKYPDTAHGVYNHAELSAIVAEEKATEAEIEAVKQVFSTGEAAKFCKVAPRTVMKWFDSGKLKGYRIPGSNDRRIPREQLIRFMKDNGMTLLAELEPPVPALPGDGTLFGPDAPTAQKGGL